LKAVNPSEINGDNPNRDTAFGLAAAREKLETFQNLPSINLDLSIYVIDFEFYSHL
jgi:hypothetical protein